MTDSSTLKRLEDGMEKLAAVEHERWAHWQRYMHAKGSRLEDGSLVLPADLVERWERQMETSYDSLPDEEKESDRDQVRRYLPVVSDLLDGG